MGCEVSFDPVEGFRLLPERRLTERSCPFDDPVVATLPDFSGVFDCA